MTASMTPCVTTARSWICEPTPIHTSEDYTSNNTLCDSPLLDLRTLTPTGRHLQRHPVWQPGLGSANPDPYTHHTTPPPTPCVTARSWLCEPWPLHTSNDTLCDRPVLDLRTLTPTHTRRHLQRHPVWQPPPQRIHKTCKPSPPNLK